MPHFSSIRRRAAAFGVAALLLAGCSTRVENTGDYAPAAGGPGSLRRPAQVLVYDFVVDWHQVQLDEGIRARLERVNAGGSLSQDQQTVASEVQAAIADTLVSQVNGMGLSAVRAAPSTRPRPGDVIVSGQVVKIDAGNATRRNLIGFGAGKSEVYADAEVYASARGERTTLLQTYDADANSGRTPGLGIGAASAAAGSTAAAVTSGVVGTASRFHSGPPQDAERLAKRISVNLGRFFAAQGWIAESAIPSLSR